MSATFFVGDAIQVMDTLPEKSVDLVLTSPPFLALRSYLPADHPDKALEGGSQASPGEYIDWLLDVVEACTRVLAPHGSLCFELGDTYSGPQPPYRYTLEHQPDAPMRTKTMGIVNEVMGESNITGRVGPGWPLAKSLSLIPESFRWAMVYGRNPFTGRKTEPWRLRNVIRWVRPNPPVGALGDKFRPATSELMVFCKAKDRYFDLDAVREPVQFPDKTRTMGKKPGITTDHKDANFSGDLVWVDKQQANNPAGAPPLDWWNIPQPEGEAPLVIRKPNGRWPKQIVLDLAAQLHITDGSASDALDALERATTRSQGGAPPLDWWNIPPGGFSGAHYAVWPPELLIKPIKAMCPEKVCRMCGEPSRRIVETDRIRVGALDSHKGTEAPALRPGGSFSTQGFRVVTDESWSDCSHDDWRPGLVLDPFGGSGTTALVATGHGRDCTLIDLDERNYDLALDRVGPFILTRGEVAA